MSIESLKVLRTMRFKEHQIILEKAIGQRMHCLTVVWTS